MSRMRPRWIAATLVLLALIPADLAVARLALRHDLTSTAVGALRGGVELASRTGAEWAGRGVNWMGRALVDGACRVADAALGRPDAVLASVGLRGADAAMVSFRLAGCDDAGMACRLATDARALERCALERAQVRLQTRAAMLDARRMQLDARRMRMETERMRAIGERLRSMELRLERERAPHAVRVMVVVDPPALPEPAAPAAAAPAPAPPRTGS